MPQERLDAGSFSPDTLDFLRVLHRYSVRYMIVGGEAVIFHGHARVTGDIDFFYERTEDNAQRLYEALRDFWKGDVPGISGPDELVQSGLVVQFGVPPNRIDLVNKIDGVLFSEAWPNRLPVAVDDGDADLTVWFIGVRDLVTNKRAAGRPKDLDDAQFLDGRGN